MPVPTDEEVLRIVASILWYAPTQGEGATPEFDAQLADLLRDAPPLVFAVLAGMTALAQELLDVYPEEAKNKFWADALPDGPI